MAKPRIFLSSTCYDLADARAALTTFLEGYGFEVLNSQDKKFGVKPKVHSHDACLEMMQNADYVVLIIGGRRGGNYVGSDKSITNEEIKAAQKLDRPIFAFVDKKVEALRLTYKKNPTADFKPTVEDNRVFDFIDWVGSAQEGNWIWPFDNVTDVQEVLRAQFAYILLLYSQGLRKTPGSTKPKTGQPLRLPASLEGVPGDTEGEKTDFRAGLRQVHETLSKILKSGLPDAAKTEQMKAVWVLARYGEAEGSYLNAKEDVFKGYTWGKTRGQKVFNQMAEFGVTGDYDYDEDHNGVPFGTVRLRFTGKSDGYPAEALTRWVGDLIKRHGDDEALDFFKRLDMSLYIEAAAAKAHPKLKKVAGAK